MNPDAKHRDMPDSPASADDAQLFLITPPYGGEAPLREALAAALGAGEVACVLLRHAGRDERSAKTLVRELAPLVQKSGAALLVEDDPRLAAHVDADGVHMRGLGDPLEEALERMKPARIVGVGALGSRDDAMTAGEEDVDYLLFGEPDPDGTVPSPAWTRERIGWWAEIFNVPCVGYAASLAEVEPLAAAGADFVALSEAVFADPRGAAVATAEALASLRAGSAALAARRP